MAEFAPMLPPLPQALRDPRCYPHAADPVEVIETHISWVFLAGDFAYKVKRPVDTGFCDFTTLERRRFFCEEELRLNRRTAPKIYLGVVPIVLRDGTLLVEGSGEPVEFAVKMWRFPQAMLLDSLASAGRLGADLIDSLARIVARMHRTAAAAAPATGPGAAADALALALDNFGAIEALGVPPAQEELLARLREWTQAEFRAIEPVMKARERDGSVRECHGDLHLGNIVLADGEPLPFDCVEFDPRLRWIDVMSDVAFLAMDLEAHGLPRLAARFLTQYLEETGDYGGLRVLRFYRVYRALVRAKIERIRGAQGGAEAAATRFAGYVDLALRQTVRRPAGLEITSGVSGSGKSTVALRRAEASGAVRIRSDVERKRMHGLESSERTRFGVNEGLYAAAATDAVYERLAALAKEAIEAGYPVIVDATFLERSRRERFHRLAEECAVPFRIVSCEAPDETLRERVAQRVESGGDASDARLDVLRRQLASRECIRPGEGPVEHVSTG